MSQGSEKHKNASPAQVLSKYLRSSGRRLTPERTAILDVALRLRGHFTADTVRESLAVAGQPAAVATVYSGLSLLVECGILRTLTLEGSPTLYQVAAQPHHHVVCTICNKVKDIADSDLDAFVSSRRYDGFAATGASLTVYGICAGCQRRRRRSATTSKNKQAKSDTPNTIK